MAVHDVVIGELKEPLVWKYTGLAAILLAVAFGLLGHFALDWGVTTLLGMLPDWVTGRLKDIQGSSGISFLMAFLLFPLLMPLFGIVAMPMLAGIQLLLAENLSRSFDAKYYADRPSGHSSTITNLGIWLKWTFAKVLVFFLLIPLLHVPLLGSVVHVGLVAIWLTVMYFEVVARRYTRGRVWGAFRGNAWWLTKAALLSTVFTYGVFWLLGVVAVIVPHLKLAVLFVAAVLVTTGNFVLLVELLRHYRENVQDVRESTTLRYGTQ